MKVIKKFEDCSHRGFGKYCHKCKPWPPKDPKEQLKSLDKRGLKAVKERKRLKKKIEGKKGK